MEIREAMKGQYRAGLEMLRQCIDRCPDEVWISGSHPRNFWRIAYHALFYTHLYLEPSEETFSRWDKHPESANVVWENPPIVTAPSRAELLAYLYEINASVDAKVDALDLNSPDPGFSWYSIPKLDHQLLNLRHLQGHIGQLSELLMAQGIDIDWVSRR